MHKHESEARARHQVARRSVLIVNELGYQMRLSLCQMLFELVYSWKSSHKSERVNFSETQCRQDMKFIKKHW